jgi:hypothetical protein
MVKITFDVQEGHRLSSPWHLNFISAKSPEQAMSAAHAYIASLDQNRIYRYRAEFVGK